MTELPTFLICIAHYNIMCKYDAFTVSAYGARGTGTLHSIRCSTFHNSKQTNIYVRILKVVKRISHFQIECLIEHIMYKYTYVSIFIYTQI